MKRIVVSDIFDLASRMLEKVDKCATVSAVLFGEEAFELMRELLSCELISAGCIDIENANDYDLEYYVTIECDDMTLWVEPAWSKGDEHQETGYIKNDTDILYIDGGASYAIVKAQENSNCKIYQVDFRDEYYDCSECEECDRCEEDDDLAGLIIDLIGFFDDLIDPDKHAADKADNCEMATSKEILEFINRRFHDKSVWLYGNCYYFSVILKDRFPGGRIVYDVVQGHFSYFYGGKFYDPTGIISPKDKNVVDWATFEEYDYLQKKRIIRDCIK